MNILSSVWANIWTGATSPNQAPYFSAPLKTSVASASGNTPTFTRGSTAMVRDWEGVYRTALSGEARFQGARRVENVLVASEDMQDAAWVMSRSAVATASDTVTFTAAASDTWGSYDVLYQVPTSTLL